MPPAEPWGVVAQQALASVLEQGLVPRYAMTLRLEKAFPECDPADTSVLIDALLEKGYLSMPEEDLLQIGPVAERTFGKSHYRDLLASFSSTPLLTAKYAGADVGFVDPGSLDRGNTETHILLAGRSWKVIDVDWTRRVVTLAPGGGEGSARWTGTGRVLGAEVCSAIRGVLHNGKLPGVTLSKRAVAKLDELRDDLPCAGTGPIVVSDAKDRFRVWTYGGTHFNRLLALHLRHTAGSMRHDDLAVETRRDPSKFIADLLEHKIDPVPGELEHFRQELKFGDCLPVWLLERVYVLRTYGSLVQT